MNSGQIKIYRAIYWQLWKAESRVRTFCWINVGRWPWSGCTGGRAALGDRVELKCNLLICLQLNRTHCAGSCNMICQIKRVVATTHCFCYTTTAEAIVFWVFKTRKYTNNTLDKSWQNIVKRFILKWFIEGANSRYHSRNRCRKIIQIFLKWHKA